MKSLQGENMAKTKKFSEDKLLYENQILFGAKGLLQEQSNFRTLRL